MDNNVIHFDHPHGGVAFSRQKGYFSDLRSVCMSGNRCTVWLYHFNIRAETLLKTFRMLPAAVKTKLT